MDIRNGQITNNIIRNVGGGNKGRAYGINLENGAESVKVQGNFVYNMDLGTPSPTAGHAYLLSDSFADRFNQVTIENNVAHNVDICFALDFVTNTFHADDTVNVHANVCSEPLNRGFQLQDGIFRGTISVKDNIFVSLQANTSNLMHIQNLANTSANIPSGNLFYCPSCNSIATYNRLTYGEADVYQFGQANRYDTILSNFDHAEPSLTVNQTVYRTGSDTPADDPIDDPTDVRGDTEPSNLLILEVEDYDEREGGFEHQSSVDASGDTYMAAPKSLGGDYDGDGNPLAKLHYHLNLQAGTYFLWIRTYGLHGGSDSFHVFVDDIKQRAFHTDNGHWTWKRLSNDLQLDGTHKLTLALREPETRGDKMVLTDDPDFVPTGFGPEPEDTVGEADDLFVAEAEQYADLEGAFTEGYHADASGQAYMVVPSQTGSDVDGDENPLAKLHYDLHMAPGDYTVWIRAFGQHSGADSLFVAFDSGDKKALHVATNGFQWYRVGRVYALDGHHAFTIALREANTFVDKIVITDDGDFVPTGLGPDQP